jgi:hypothetical protein
MRRPDALPLSLSASPPGARPLPASLPRPSNLSSIPTQILEKIRPDRSHKKLPAATGGTWRGKIKEHKRCRGVGQKKQWLTKMHNGRSRNPWKRTGTRRWRRSSWCTYLDRFTHLVAYTSSMPDGCVRCSLPHALVPLDPEATRARLGLRTRAAVDDLAS